MFIFIHAQRLLTSPLFLSGCALPILLPMADESIFTGNSKHLGNVLVVA
jgi:hypothetical protein